jgi:peptidoglycan biosynthesis protein MviN/MurJ (putative lipid II flippase)
VTSSPAATSDARSTAIVSLGQASIMVMGGVLALLIAHIFGKSARTDAFFAAYGVATVVIIFGQTFRLSALPKLVDREDAIPRLLAAVAVIAALAAVPMVLLADPVASLLVKRDPGGVATDSLRLLWIAVAGQLFGSMLAAILAVRRRFTLIGFAYLATGLTSIAVFLALEQAMGIKSVAVGLDVAAVLLCAVLGYALASDGVPRSSGTAGTRAVLTEVWDLSLASATYVAVNLGYVICVAVASRAGSGEATLYAYAYFSAAILVAVTATSAAMVRSPRLLSEQARSPDVMADSTKATFRVTVVIVTPLFAVAALVGRPVIGFVLGSAFGHDDTVRLVVALLCLAGWVLASAASVFAVMEMLAQRRLGQLAAVAVAQVLVLIPLAIAGREAWGIRGIALAQSLALIGAAAAQLWLAFGPRWRGTAAHMLRDTGRAVGVMAAAFAPGAVLVVALGYEAPVVVPAALLSIALAAVATRVAWPSEWRLLASVVRGRPATT